MSVVEEAQAAVNAEGSERKLTPEELLRRSQNLLQQARMEITMLRGQNASMAPKVEAYEMLLGVLRITLPKPDRSGGMHPDIIADIDRHLGIDPEEARDRSSLVGRVVGGSTRRFR